MTNHRAGRGCGVDGCEHKHAGRGYCAKHLYRLRRHGDPAVTISAKERTPTGEASAAWRGDAVGYSAAHFRLKSRRGPASADTCVQCGQQAADWAYIHGSEHELVDDRGRRYSGHVEDYQPMCVLCHHAYDNPPVTECVNGHEYDASNTYVRPDGTRDCRICRLDRVRAWRRRKRMPAA